MPTASPAERARIAHQVLRLKESGITDLDKVASLLGAVDLSQTPQDGETQTVEMGVRNPHLDVMRAVARATDHELPGPTDAEFVKSLFGVSLREIYEQWQAHSTENLKANHPEDHEAASESWARDEALREERDQGMGATGQWPSRAHGLPHGKADWAMANAHYDLGREAFLAGDLDADADDWRIILVDSADYTVNLASHQFLSSVAGAGRVAVSGALASKTVTAGVFDAADVTLSAVTGDPSEAIIIYKHTGSDATARLIGYIDTATGLPVTPNGGDIAVAWDNGSNRIFKL